MGRIDDIKDKMVEYTCHKTVKAAPMTKAGYAKLREYAEPQKDERGWVVMFEPNHMHWYSDEDFRKDYRLSERFIDRLRNEMNDLQEKINKLEDFIYSDKFDDLDEPQKGLLKIQMSAMITYYGVVKTRYDLLK